MIRGVYGIVDVRRETPEAEAEALAEALLCGGIEILQLRAKVLPTRRLLELARRMRVLTREAGATFVLNDRPDVAVLAEADAVHLGQEDLPLEAVRNWLPASIRIGISCHTPEDVRAAEAADYVGYGPVFATTTKVNPDPVVGLVGLEEVVRAHPALPVVAIGGIDLSRLPAVRRTGAAAAAMISALSRGRNAEAAARQAVTRWEEQG